MAGSPRASWRRRSGSRKPAPSCTSRSSLALTLWASRVPAPAPPDFSEALSGADHAPAVLDRWRPWLALAALLIVVAYGPTLVRLAMTTPLITPGLRVW